MVRRLMSLSGFSERGDVQVGDDKNQESGGDAVKPKTLLLL